MQLVIIEIALKQIILHYEYKSQVKLLLSDKNNSKLNKISFDFRILASTSISYY